MSNEPDGEDMWVDPITQTVWTRPTAWAYAQVCRVNEERRVLIDHIQTVSTAQVEEIRRLNADNQRLMDILANLILLMKASNGQDKENNFIIKP